MMYISLIQQIFDEEDMERELKDQRKSFMSGHSSYAFSAATWCILYLQAKVPLNSFHI